MKMRLLGMAAGVLLAPQLGDATYTLYDDVALA